MIRDRLVIGICDREVSKELQLKSELTLEQAVTTARQAEQVNAQMKQLTVSPAAGASNTDVNAVKHSGGAPRGNRRPRRGQHHGTRGRGRQNSETHETCGQCGYTKHKPGERCPAADKLCNKCHRKGHFKLKCRSKTVKEVVLDPDEEEQDTYFLGHVVIDDSEDTDDDWTVSLPVDGNRVKFKIDTGADVSIISESAYETLKPRPHLEKTKSSLYSPGGRLKTLGHFTAPVTYNGTRYRFRIFVVTGTKSCLLSRNVSIKLGLVKRVDEVVDTQSPFGKVGLLRCEPVKIRLKSDAEPYSQNVARRIAIPILPKVKSAVEQMIEDDVCEPVTTPTPWCAPIVPVIKKNGNVRICVDYRKLNQAVQRERFTLPTLDDVIHKLSDATVFSTLDASSGYWAVPLDEESRLLTTFITPMGRFCFKRLPFGISCASEIFQRIMTNMLDGTQAIVWQDDILVYGKNMKEHDEMLDAVMKRVTESGLKLNKAKCVFRQRQLRYVGHKFNESGMSPDDSKVQAIVDLEAPTNISELRRVLGMVKYLGRYLPNLATVMAPMNELLCKDVAFQWGAAQDTSFREVKDLICNSPVLAYYDVNKPTVVSCDASSYGIGGVLMQQHDDKLRPVAFCSRTLTSSERNYAQIEKECLAATWTCEKFRRYLQGLESFRLMTDHKPLVPLLNTRDIDQVPLRCQRLIIRLMPFNLRAEHVPGKVMVVADALSRAPLRSTNSTSEDDVAFHVNVTITTKPMSDRKLAEIQAMTAQDDELQQAIELTMNGWPSHKDQIPSSMIELYNVRHSLSVANGVLLMGSRIVIPQSMRSDILSSIHEGHFGVQKCRERANMSVFWPGINNDIQRLNRECEFCQENRPAQRHEPLITMSQPSRPWQKLAVDLCQCGVNKYLVIMDYYSKWIEAFCMSETTASQVIAKEKSVFARFGIPEEIVSDNGPPFDSEAMRQFASEYGIVLTTVSPHNPQANGQAESGVAIAKKLLMQKDPVKALLAYRSTPVHSTGYSPSRLLMGRELRTDIPTLPDQLQPSWPDKEVVSEHTMKTQQAYKRQFDRRHGVCPLPTLDIGSKVRVKLDGEKQWSKPATVVQSHDTPRSYIIQTDDGKQYRRNRRHLQSIPVQPVSTPETVPEKAGTLLSKPPNVQMSTNTSSQAPSPEMPSVEAPSQPTVRTTRSGRQVKPTVWSKDYVTS